MKRFQSKKLRDAARGRNCVLCEFDGLYSTDTTVAAHLPGSFYGMSAGYGQKTHDWLVAHLCVDCHELVDSDGRRDATLRMKALCLTLERLFDEGVIIVR